MLLTFHIVPFIDGGFCDVTVHRFTG